MSSGPFIWIQYALGISLVWGKVPHCHFSHGIMVTVFGVTVSLFLARARSPVSWNICSLHRYEENLKVSLFFSESLLICQLKHMFIIQIRWKSFGVLVTQCVLIPLHTDINKPIKTSDTLLFMSYCPRLAGLQVFPTPCLLVFLSMSVGVSLVGTRKKHNGLY
jgi:hypothetical protein